MTTIGFSSGIQRCTVSLLLLSNLLTIVPQVALAASGQVKLCGTIVMTTNAGANGLSLEDRTQSIQDNLDNALVAAKDRSPSAVHVVTTKSGSVITLSGYKIVTVTAADAKAAKTTSPILANRWAASLRKQLANKAATDNYVAQLTGQANVAENEPQAAPPRQAPIPATAVQPQAAPPLPPVSDLPPPQAFVPPVQSAPPAQFQGRVVYAPAGLTLSIVLSSGISTQVAKAGDLVQASVNQSIDLGNGQIPAGSVVTGQVTDSDPGRRLDRSGTLSIKFTSLRTPDGVQTPITAHLVGEIGKYAQAGGDGSGTIKAETAKNKVESVAIRGAVGAGTGAALGTAIGAIAGGKEGVGKGAWSGTAIGGGIGIADSLLLRKAKDVVIPSGTQLQLQLDAPASIGPAM